MAVSPGPDRNADRGVRHADHHTHRPPRGPAGSTPGQTARPPAPPGGPPGTGRRSVLTLADRLLATLLHYRLGLPQVAIARLFTVMPFKINRRIRDIRQLLARLDTSCIALTSNSPPGAPLRPRERGRDHRPARDQDGELMIRRP
ncbi:transposase family protein [Streptomyces sp. NPDC097727]|uniref:transposase family protein n=1 Tax=Streptomyces sp. NPDC097727 TaxID=3366092 RepID=UPI0037FF2062